jgi:hypothetical protein
MAQPIKFISLKPKPKREGTKLSVYLTVDAAAALYTAAEEMDRSVSWLVQQAIQSALPLMVIAYKKAVRGIK